MSAATKPDMVLSLLPAQFAICRLEPTASLPAWAGGGRFLSITRSVEELSIIAEEDLVPPEIMAERGWRCLRVRGTMAFETTGVAAAIAAPLAEVGVSLLIIATYDTDYLLVKDAAILRRSRRGGARESLWTRHEPFAGAKSTNRRIPRLISRA